MATSEKEQSVLVELIKDSDRPRKQIASVLGMSESEFSRTVGSLRERGIIKKFTVDIDYGKIGYPDTGIFMFSLNDRNQAEGILPKLAEINEIIEIHEVFSEDHDIIVKIMCEDNKRIREVCKRISSLEEVKNDSHTFTIIFAGTAKSVRGIDLSPHQNLNLSVRNAAK